MELELKRSIINKIDNSNDENFLREISFLFKSQNQMSIEEFHSNIQRAEKDIEEGNLYSNEQISNLFL